MQLRKREPFFGPNAKPFFFQLFLGITIPFVLYEIGMWHFFYDLTGYLLGLTD